VDFAEPETSQEEGEHRPGLIEVRTKKLLALAKEAGIEAAPARIAEKIKAQGGKCSESQIWGMRNGSKPNPGVNTLMDFLRGLDDIVPLDWFSRDADLAAYERHLTLLGLARKSGVREIVSGLKGLTEDNIKLLWGMINNMRVLQGLEPVNWPGDSADAPPPSDTV
jgi:hypothetical protein